MRKPNRPTMILGVDSGRFKVPPTKKKTFGIAAVPMVTIKVLRMMVASVCQEHFEVSPGPFNKRIVAGAEWIVIVRNKSTKPRRFMACAFAEDLTPMRKRRAKR